MNLLYDDIAHVLTSFSKIKRCCKKFHQVDTKKLYEITLIQPN